MTERATTGSIDPRRWSRIREVFAQVYERPIEERGALLDDLCSGDDLLRMQVASFLDVHGEATRAEVEQPSELGSAEFPSVEPYRVDRFLARGGMGVVYVGSRADGAFRKRVAIKVLSGVPDLPNWRARFRAEREILAYLEHPYIARLIDGGSTSDGHPFLVMELVDGLSIDDFVARSALGLRGTLSLFLKVCSAVSAAHSSLIVHRDLKPGNILVTEAAEPKLLDFGIAKLLSPERVGVAAPETLPHLACTPEYAAPEQLLGEPVSAASDVYSLGVILFELLTGTALCSAAEGYPWLRLQASGGDPIPKPSEVSRRRNRRALRGDLDAIVLRTLHSERGARYQSVEALAADLERHLRGEPVRARQRTAPYRLGRFLRRNRWPVALGATIFLGLIAVAALLGLQGSRMAEERDRTLQETQRAEVVHEAFVELLGGASPKEDSDRELTARTMLVAARDSLVQDWDRDADLRAELLDKLGGVFYRLGYVEEARISLNTAVELWAAAGHREQSVGALSQLANLYAFERSFDQAESLLQESLEIRRREFGASSVSAAWGYLDLGRLRHRQWRLDEAEDLYERGRELSNLLGDAQAQVAALTALGAVRWSHGDPETASELYSKAIRTAERELTKDDRDLPSLRGNLAAVLHQQGRHEEAERALRLALAQLKRRYGANNARLAGTQQNLGSVLVDRGKHQEAEQLLRKSTQHDSVGLYDLGQTLEGQGRYVEALTAYDDAHLHFTEHLPNHRIGLAVILAARARGHRMLGSMDACVRDARSASELLKEAELNPRDRRFVAEARVVLGTCLLQQGEQGRLVEGRALIIDNLEPLNADFRWRAGVIVKDADAVLAVLDLRDSGATF